MKKNPTSVGHFIKLKRNAPRTVLEPFMNYFQGFEQVQAVKAIFGKETKPVLQHLRIGFIPFKRMFMGVRDNDGNLAVGTYHLRTSPTRTIYLDIIHELFHVKQRMKDVRYFHREHMKYMQGRGIYWASPIEVPAYRYTVREARLVGMSDEEIVEYLKTFDAPPKVWSNFLKVMGLGDRPQPRRGPVAELPVKIRRDIKPRTYPFTRYFKGFEKLPAVKKLFGDRTDEVLKNIQVEFIESPIPSIYPSEEDGHLLVARDHFRKASVKSIYLDVYLSLDLIKRYSAGGSQLEVGVGEGRGERLICESFAVMVNEAKRLGFRRTEILKHTTLLRFILPIAEYRKFLKEQRLG